MRSRLSNARVHVFSLTGQHATVAEMSDLRCSIAGRYVRWAFESETVAAPP